MAQEEQQGVNPPSMRPVVLLEPYNSESTVRALQERGSRQQVEEQRETPVAVGAVGRQSSNGFPEGARAAPGALPIASGL